MCLRCLKLAAEGVPKSERPYHNPMHRKSLDERIAEMKQRKAERGILLPPHLFTNELRAARLRAIREKLGLTIHEMANMIVTPVKTYYKFEHNEKNIPLVYVELAQMKYRAIRNKQSLNRLFKRMKNPKRVRNILNIDPATRSQVIVMYTKGMTESEIARELALREDIVDICLMNVAE